MLTNEVTTSSSHSTSLHDSLCLITNFYCRIPEFLPIFILLFRFFLMLPISTTLQQILTDGYLHYISDFHSHSKRHNISQRRDLWRLQDFGTFVFV